MKMKRPLSSHAPALLVAIGIILAAAVAALAPFAQWPVLTGPLLLSAAIVGSDMLRSRLTGAAPIPSWCSVLLAGAFLVACGLVAFVDPKQVALMIPILGGSVSTPLLLGTGRRGECRGPR
jgi:hypothetical protein